MNYGKLTAGTTKTAIDTAKPSEKGEIITYLSRMGDVLENIFEGSNLTFALLAVDGVIHSNKADTVVWKITVRVVSNGNIVTAEARQVFHHHSRHKAHLNITEHLLESGTVEICSRIPVVHIVFCVGQSHLLRFLREQALLIGDGIAVAVHSVVTG